MDKTAIENMTLDQLKELETELKGQVPSDVVELKRVQDRINFEEQAEEVRKLNQEQEAAQQVRIQAQEEKVDSITLPYDFNDLFSDDEYKNAQGQPHKVTVANSMIIELIKELQRKAYDDHNAEIQTLTDTHKEDLRTGQDREAQLKRQNDELHQSLEKERTQALADAAEHASLLQQIAQMQLDKQDADSKRDAAVKQLEEVQAEITQLKGWNDDLRAQAAQGVRKAIDVVDISPTDKLAQMVKETNEQKANRALARWNTIMPEVVAPPVVSAGEAVFQPEHPQADIPAHPVDQTGTSPISADHQEVAAPAAPFQGEVQMASGLPSEDGQGGEKISRQEIDQIKARIDRLEKQANLSAELPTAV